MECPSLIFLDHIVFLTSPLFASPDDVVGSIIGNIEWRERIQGWIGLRKETIEMEAKVETILWIPDRDGSAF